MIDWYFSWDLSLMETYPIIFVMHFQSHLLREFTIVNSLYYILFYLFL